MVALAIVVALVVAAPERSSAHDRGYSTSELVVADDGEVVADYTFSAADLAAAHVDGDALVARGALVRADGAGCPGALERFVETGGDGVEVRITYRCTAGAARVELALDVLAELGGRARNVARIARGPQSTQAILTPTARTLALDAAGTAPRATAPVSHGPSAPWIVVPIVVLFAFALYLRYGRSP
jgi:hypothetical protein